MIKVFLDGAYFYQDFIKTKINYVNYVRDHTEAQVHILITSQSTGGGGTAYTFFFLGQHDFANLSDTLLFNGSVNNTDDEIRKGIVSTLIKGLMPYVLQSPIADQLTIQYTPADSSNTTTDSEKDPWNSWVFSINASGYGSGEKSNKSFSGWGGVSASKVTDDIDVTLSANYSRDYNQFKYQGYNYKSNTESKEFSSWVVKSVSDHWSLGTHAGIFSSSYSNYNIGAYAGPAVEWNFFPYSASTTKLFTLYYELSPSYTEYTDTTIYNKTQEFLIEQSLRAQLILKEKWGSLSTQITGANFLENFDQHKLDVSQSINWRIVEGLSVSLSGNFDIVHNQVNLPKNGASQEEVLLQLHELQTNFRYNTYLSINYSFGSIYNNVVNSRFFNSSY